VPGAKYQSSFTNPETGGIIDRYIVPQRSAVPVRQVVPEVQQFSVSKQIMVPDVKEIQVPQTRMVPQQHTVMEKRIKMVPVEEMVPRTVTKMVPEQYMTTQQVRTERAVTVQQPMQRTIQKVIEGQKIVEAAKVIEYERPRVIPGRYIGQSQTAAREVGLQWTKQYYSGVSQAQASGQAVTVATPNVQYSTQLPITTTVPTSTQYIGGGTQYLGGSTQYIGGNTQYIGGNTQYIGGGSTFAGSTYGATTLPTQYVQGGQYQTYGKEADFEGYTTGDQAGTVI